MKWVIGFFSLLAVLVAIPFFVTASYYLGVIIVVMINVLLACSIWLILRTGQASLGHAAFAAIGGYISAALVKSYGFSFWPSLVIAMIVAGVVALFIGFLTLRTKSHYFIIVTAAFGEIVRIIFSNIDRPFGGFVGILNLPSPDPIAIPGLPPIEFTTTTPYYYLTLILVMLCLLILFRVDRSRIGLVFRSIDQADKLAEHIGVNIMSYKILAFVIGSTFAGLAGVLYAFNAKSMLPASFTFWHSIYALIYVTAGGSANIIGPILGATVFTGIAESLRGAQMWEPVIYGSLLIICMLFFKNGLLGALNTIWNKLTRGDNKKGRVSI